MDEQTFRIVFHGKIAAGQDPAVVKERLSQTFKLDKDRVEQLLSGSRVVLKRNLSQTTAVKYKQAFEPSGAVCTIEGDGGAALQMEVRNLHETPEKARTGTLKNSSGSTTGEAPSSRNVSKSAEDRTTASTGYTDSRESATDTKPEVSGVSEFGGWWQAWGSRITGLLAGGFVFNLVYMGAEAFGLQGDSRTLAAAVAGVATWYFSRRWAREKGDDRNFCLLILAVALILAMASTSWRYSTKSGEPVKPAENRLENLRIVMNAIQGLVLEQQVPFPKTQEEVLKIITTYRQLFPPTVWRTGPDLFKDAWGTPIRYEGDSDMRYLIRSAGPDKIHETEDDKILTNRGK